MARLRIARRFKPPSTAARIKAFIVPVAAAFAIYAAVLQAWHISVLDVVRVMVSQLSCREGLRRVFLSSMPIFFPALGLVVAFRSGVWNIGAEGQLLLGMVGAAWIALFHAAGPATPILMVLAAMVFGAAWALPPALLRGLLGVNEVLTTLMLNYVAAFLLNYLVEGQWRDPRGYGFIKTSEFPPDARIGVAATMALAAVLAASVACLMHYTRMGFYLQVMGAGPRTAMYAGASPPRLVAAAMMISGALAGAGGMVVASSLTGMLMDAGRMSPGYGYTAIIAAWLAKLSPAAVIPSSLFLGLLTEISFALQSSLGIGLGATLLLEGMLLLAAAASRFLEEYEVIVEP